MIIIGVDFHPEFQQIAFVDTDSGELEERRLHHPDEAVVAYRTPAPGIVPAGSVGQPATARPAGVAGSIEPHHRGVKPGGGTGSGEVS